jgi:hypothetical protein
MSETEDETEEKKNASAREADAASPKKDNGALVLTLVCAALLALIILVQIFGGK